MCSLSEAHRCRIIPMPWGICTRQCVFRRTHPCFCANPRLSNPLTYLPPSRSPYSSPSPLPLIPPSPAIPTLQAISLLSGTQRHQTPREPLTQSTQKGAPGRTSSQNQRKPGSSSDVVMEARHIKAAQHEVLLLGSQAACPDAGPQQVSHGSYAASRSRLTQGLATGEGPEHGPYEVLQVRPECLRLIPWLASSETGKETVEMERRSHTYGTHPTT